MNYLLALVSFVFISCKSGTSSTDTDFHDGSSEISSIEQESNSSSSFTRISSSINTSMSSSSELLSSSSSLSELLSSNSSENHLSSEEVSSSSQTSSSPQGSQWRKTIGNCGTFVDERDGQEYRWTKIGEQKWMAENLNYDVGSFSFCYDDVPENCINYGRLYRWREAMNGSLATNAIPSGVQGVCPAGWHLPSDGEWEILAEYVSKETGVGEIDGDNWRGIASKLKSTSGWNHDANGTDDFGFAGLSGGYYLKSEFSQFHYLGSIGSWWTATAEDETSSQLFYRNLHHGDFYKSWGHRSYRGSSVRCIMD